MRLPRFMKRKKKEETENPWASTKEPKEEEREDVSSFSFYTQDKWHRFERRIDSFSSKKYHVHFLLRVKRIVAVAYFVFFFGLAVVSNTNGLFFFIFLGAAYFFLDYLWKTRRISWEKKKE